jgi:hypothetical protein
MARKRKGKKEAKQEIKEFSDGKDHIAEEASHARNLEDLIGTKRKSPFAAESLAEFEAKLGAMQLTQMQEMAVNAGVFPSGTKLTLKNKLIKAFKQQSQGAGRVVQVTRHLVEPGSDLEKKILGR